MPSGWYARAGGMLDLRAIRRRAASHGVWPPEKGWRPRAPNEHATC